MHTVEPATVTAILPSRAWRPTGPLVSHQALAAYTEITDLCLAGIVGSKELRK